MTIYLKQSTASQEVPLGYFVDSTDGNTEETGLTIANTDIKVWKAGATTLANKNSGGATHISNGVYYAVLDATDTNTLGSLKIFVHVSGALPIILECVVLAANVYDSLIGGGDVLDISVTEWLGTAAATPTVAGVPEVDVTHLGGGEQSLTDLKDFADAGYDPATNKVEGVKLVDTTTTNTDMLTAAAVNAEVDTALVDVNLDHLVGTATGIPAVPAGTYLDQIMDDGTATFDRTTDSLQAIRDRGDAAWTTGGGGSITDILNVIPLIPNSIDLASTATYRIGLMLTNALDDLPGTAEIDPGTVSIDRKAVGGTSWSAVVTDAACSESAGLVYYDEVFDSGTGYAAGDSIRVTFKGQKITVSANDYEVTDATGRIFYTHIRETMRGTDNAFLASSAPTNFSVLGIETDGDLTKVNTLDGHTAQTGDNFARLGAPAGASVSADIAAVQTTADATEVDTQNIQGRLPTALSSGRMKSDMEAISGDATAADNLAESATAIVVGAATAATLSTTQMSTNLSEATDEHYTGAAIVWTTGALLGQRTDITAYNGTTKTLTFTAVTEAPSNGDAFVLI